MEVSEVLALIAALGLIGLYLKIRSQKIELLRSRLDTGLAEQKEIEKQTEVLKKTVVEEKEEYEKAKLKVFAVVDGDKPDDGDGSSN